MTYSGFLLRFVVVPALALLIWALVDARRGKALPQALRGWPAWGVLLAHCLIALVYTTPWDNYLVATRVWWYDENLVWGITLGWVPLEEYLFFVLQPLLTGLLLLTLLRYLPVRRRPDSQAFSRILPLAALAVLWLGAALILLLGWQSGTYLGLLLVWALPPVMLQVAFGSDILWRHRRAVLLAILISTLYLAMADSLAIASGTWTINPEQSLRVYLPGGLPLEELIFFLFTNVLVSFGVTLVLAEESQTRFWTVVRRLRTAQS